jgi:hypothetical protein
MTIDRISNWQDALVAQILGKVDVLEIYEEQVCSEKLTFNIPAVSLGSQVLRAETAAISTASLLLL